MRKGDEQAIHRRNLNGQYTYEKITNSAVIRKMQIKIMRYSSHSPNSNNFKSMTKSSVEKILEKSVFLYTTDGSRN